MNNTHQQKPDIRRLNLYHSSLDSIQCVYGAHPITGLNNDVKILINKTWSKQKNNVAKLIIPSTNIYTIFFFSTRSKKAVRKTLLQLPFSSKL